MASVHSNKRTILLVDDDPSLLATVGQFLSFEGYEVVTADSGEAAIERLKTVRPNLIILDMSMPGIGGMGFLKNITEPSGKLQYPVLVLTARAQMAGLFASTQVDGFIPKPAHPDDLLTEVGRILFLRGAEVADEKVVVRKVVLGEHDAARATALSAALVEAGYEVEMAESGPMVVEKAFSTMPEAILARCDLAQLDASSLVNLIRQMPALKTVPVVVYGSDSVVQTLVLDSLTLVAGESTPQAILPILGQLF